MSNFGDQLWYVRPAGAPHGGRPVDLHVLCRAIEDELIGDLDEVKGPGEVQWRPVGEHPKLIAYIPQPTSVKTSDEEDAESDLTPMIDVTFQLLIFFMITATFVVQKTLDAPKAEANSEAAGKVTMEELEKTNIMVRVAADGGVTVDDQLAQIDNLPTLLREAASRKKASELVMDVADEAIHDVVVRVIDAAGAAEIEQIHFVSRAPP